MRDDPQVYVLVKGAERYLFIYNHANRAEALRAIGRCAANPKLNFTWHDAAHLSARILGNEDQSRFLD